MNREELEPLILEMWMKSRISMTRAHIQYYTGVSRRKLNRLLDDLVDDGFLEVEVDEDGEMIWTVPGAHRAIDGPETIAQLEKRRAIKEAARRKVRERAGLLPKQVDDDGERDDQDSDEGLAIGKTALALTGKALGALDKPRGSGDGKKSLLLSAGLSLFGPLGWFYAGSFKEAVPATAAAVLIGAILPTFLLSPILTLAMPASAIAGLVYAWQYNRSGKRTPLFLESSEEKAKNKKKGG